MGMWIRTVKEKTKNVFYEHTFSNIRIFATLGIEKYNDGTALLLHLKHRL